MRTRACGIVNNRSIRYFNIHRYVAGLRSKQSERASEMHTTKHTRWAKPAVAMGTSTREHIPLRRTQRGGRTQIRKIDYRQMQHKTRLLIGKVIWKGRDLLSDASGLKRNLLRKPHMADLVGDLLSIEIYILLFQPWTRKITIRDFISLRATPR